MQRLAVDHMVFGGYAGDDCASEGEQRAARGMVQGLEAMDDTRERVIALEVKMDHLTDQLKLASEKLDAIHQDWQAAKGARWVLVGVASVAATVSGLVVKFWPVVK